MPEPQSLIYYREFNESNIRIESLLDEKTMLLNALKEVSSSPSFKQSKHPGILKMLDRVSLIPAHTISPTEMLSIDFPVIAGRGRRLSAAFA